MKEKKGNGNRWKDNKEEKGNMNLFFTVEVLLSWLQYLVRIVWKLCTIFVHLNVAFLLIVLVCNIGKLEALVVNKITAPSLL